MALNRSTFKQTAVDVVSLMACSYTLKKAFDLNSRELNQITTLLLIGSIGSNFLFYDQEQEQDTPSPNQSSVSLQTIKNTAHHYWDKAVTFFNIPEEEDSEVVRTATDAIQMLVLNS